MARFDRSLPESQVRGGRYWIGFSVALVVCLAIGCSGKSADSNQATSHDELTEFLQDNPEFADPGTASHDETLGLE